MTVKKENPKVRGRFCEYIEKSHCAMAEGYARDGKTHEEIAERLGISCSTLYKWKDAYSKFADALNETPQKANLKVESALMKRAAGYDWEKVETEFNGKGELVKIKKTIVHVPPDPVCMLFWLKGQFRLKHGDVPTDFEKGKSEISALFTQMRSAGVASSSS